MIIDKKKIRVVCSLTTIPDILKNNKKEFEKMLDTLINIFDDVYLGIPKISNITKKPYPKFNYKSVKIVELEKDYGPICKILGALKHEKDPNTYIVTVDDDVKYTLNLKEFIKKSIIKYPNDVCTIAGIIVDKSIFSYIFIKLAPIFLFFFFNICFNNNAYYIYSSYGKYYKNNKYLTILCGFPGCIYPRKVIKKDFYKFFKKHTKIKDIFLNDDVLLSAYLAKHKINRINANYYLKKNTFDGEIEKNYNLHYDILFTKRLFNAYSLLYDECFSKDNYNQSIITGAYLIILIVLIMKLL